MATDGSTLGWSPPPLELWTNMPGFRLLWGKASGKLCVNPLLNQGGPIQMAIN